MQLHIKLKFFFDFTEIKLGMAWAFDDMVTNAANKTTFIDSLFIYLFNKFFIYWLIHKNHFYWYLYIGWNPWEVKSEVEISM